LIGISVGTFSIHVAKSTSPSLPPDVEPIPIDPFNITIPSGICVDDLLWDPIIIPQYSYYGIFPLSLMNLVVDAMFSGWVGVFVYCLTFYSLSRRFVWGRKKILVVSILTIVGGVSLALISWFHQVTNTMLGWPILDVSYIFYGYPFVWFKASWGFFGSPHWQYEIQPYGLVGNIAFYMWLIFGSLIGFMILHKRIWKSPQLQKTS